MPLDPRIVDLVVRYEEAREQGRPVTPEELCRACPELLAELKQNLGGLERVDRLVEAPRRQEDDPAQFRTVGAAVPRNGSFPGRLPRVEGFVLLAELGAGGMGVVYKARQLRLNRVVALKMILTGVHAAPAERERFRREAEMVARLQHPHIVQIYEFGEQDGIPYLVLEYADGGSLAQHLRRVPEPPREAARFVETLARAVHAAHQQGIVHRDLKPANILLQRKATDEHRSTQISEEGKADLPSSLCVHLRSSVADSVPKITDFGLAKRLDASAAQTRTGDLLGTPSYLAPEQTGNDGRYVLRVFRGQVHGDRLVTEEPQVRSCGEYHGPLRHPVFSPDARLLAMATDDDTVRLEDVTGARPGMVLRGHTDRLTSLTFAPDGGTLISTSRDGTVRRWDVRGRQEYQALQPDADVVGFHMVAVAPVGGTFAAGAGDGSVWLFDRETGQVRHRYSVGGRTLLLMRMGDEIIRRNPAWLGGNLGRRVDDMRIRALAYSPDGKLLAAASADRAVKLLHTETGAEVATLPEEHEAVACLAFSPDGALLAVNHRHEVRLWDVATRRKVRTLTDHRDTVRALAFRSDGRLLASGGQDARIRLWDPAAGRILGSLVGHQDTVAGLAFSPHDGGRTLASGGWDGKVKLWHLATRNEMLTLEAHTGRVNAVAFAPDGSVLASGGETAAGAGEVFLWRANSK